MWQEAGDPARDSADGSQQAPVWLFAALRCRPPLPDGVAVYDGVRHGVKNHQEGHCDKSCNDAPRKAHDLRIVHVVGVTGVSETAVPDYGEGHRVAEQSDAAQAKDLEKPGRAIQYLDGLLLAPLHVERIPRRLAEARGVHRNVHVGVVGQEGKESVEAAHAATAAATDEKAHGRVRRPRMRLEGPQNNPQRACNPEAETTEGKGPEVVSGSSPVGPPHCATDALDSVPRAEVPNLCRVDGHEVRDGADDLVEPEEGTRGENEHCPLPWCWFQPEPVANDILGLPTRDEQHCGAHLQGQQHGPAAEGDQRHELEAVDLHHARTRGLEAIHGQVHRVAAAGDEE
mmetsp:Transcript_137081/g.382249  ORF Transcript_137081/g.382249 Transcript_137081/m.382249 type:complete len:343 (+) Transcript_137081:449-1477(+)